MSPAVDTKELMGRTITPFYSGGSVDLYLVTPEIFSEICSYWEDLSRDRLPIFKNISISTNSNGQICVKVWVSPIGIGHVFCLKAEYPPQSKLPDVPLIWPKLTMIEEREYFETQAQDRFSKGGVAWVNS